MNTHTSAHRHTHTHMLHTLHTRNLSHSRKLPKTWLSVMFGYVWLMLPCVAACFITHCAPCFKRNSIDQHICRHCRKCFSCKSSLQPHATIILIVLYALHLHEYISYWLSFTPSLSLSRYIENCAINASHTCPKIQKGRNDKYFGCIIRWVDCWCRKYA